MTKNRATGTHHEPRGIGLFGGTFDPIHRGHVEMGRTLLAQFPMTRILYVPCADPPHKEPSAITDATHRLAMVRLALANEDGLEASDLEIQRGGTSYTVVTLRELRQTLDPKLNLILILGADAAAGLATWRDKDEIFRLCDFAVLPRLCPTPDTPGLDAKTLEKELGESHAHRLVGSQFETAPIDISSTKIRGRIEAGESLTTLVHPDVEHYMRAQGLYGLKTASPGSIG